MGIKRDKYLGELVSRMHNGMVKAITGVRRCGKTYLLFDILKKHLRGLGCVYAIRILLLLRLMTKKC